MGWVGSTIHREWCCRARQQETCLCASSQLAMCAIMAPNVNPHCPDRKPCKFRIGHRVISLGRSGILWSFCPTQFFWKSVVLISWYFLTAWNHYWTTESSCRTKKHTPSIKKSWCHAVYLVQWCVDHTGCFTRGVAVTFQRFTLGTSFLLLASQNLQITTTFFSFPPKLTGEKSSRFISSAPRPSGSYPSFD